MASEPDQINLIMQLRRRGIRDTRVLRAIELVPRELFVDPAFAGHAYQDIALPIECGQTISQPYVVAFMTEKLAPRGEPQGAGDRHRVRIPGSGPLASLRSHLHRRALARAAEGCRPPLRQARHYQRHHHHRRWLDRLAAAGALRPHHRHRRRARSPQGPARSIEARRAHDHPLGRNARHAVSSCRSTRPNLASPTSPCFRSASCRSCMEG